MYSSQDDVPWEEQHGDEKKSTLPYSFDPLKYASEIRYTPFGNCITTDMAIETISNDNIKYFGEIIDIKCLLGMRFLNLFSRKSKYPLTKCISFI
jgi:hypothetical protein